MSAFLADASRFIASCISYISITPLQLYCSAVMFAPENSIVYSISNVPKWIIVKPSMEQDWSPCRQTLEGHRDGVYSVAYSGDGCTLASASYDDTIKLWDTATGQCRQTLEGHRNSVYSVAFSGDGCTLASASYDHTVKLWDTATGQCRQTLEGHRNSVQSVAFSGDGCTLASASDDHTVKLWDTATGQCRQTLHVGKALYTLSFDPTGSCIHTDIGTISLDPLSSLSSFRSSSIISPTSQEPYYDGYGISADNTWIMWNSERLLWLPPEYRPMTSAVTGSAIALGCQSGRVLIWRFSSDPPVSV